jgi:hypothetical protein
MSLHHEHNTRLTPEKTVHGGAREGAGRRKKENRHPNVGESHSAARQASRVEKKESDDYQQQQEDLVNPMGRSWGYHECALLLTLILGLVLHYGETPTDALRVASSIMRRSYDNLHTLWTKWRNERLVYTVDSSGRGAGAVSHIDHAHHVSVEVIFLIIEYIRYTNAAGTGCTSTELQRCILVEQRLSIPDRTLRTVLSSMGVSLRQGQCDWEDERRVVCRPHSYLPSPVQQGHRRATAGSLRHRVHGRVVRECQPCAPVHVVPS